MIIPNAPGGGVDTSARITAQGRSISLGRTGKARMLAVTAAQRTPSVPDYPTVNEAPLKGFDAIS